MVSISMEFETILHDQGLLLFLCPSELHLDESYQNIIHSTISKQIIKNQPDSEENHRLEEVIESKLAVEFSVASIRQDASAVNFED